MAISTDSIIHYTKSIKSLSGILKEGFKIKYCSEQLEIGDGYRGAAHPMISFCDLPLSDSQRHFKSYGHYGIGLNKHWATDQGLNPVIYLESESLLAKSIEILFDHHIAGAENLTAEQKLAIIHIKAFAKNYSGKLKLGSKVIDNYRYYDEREWRFVPTKKMINNKTISVSLEKYLSDKDHYNDKISKIRVKFSVKDISYIIVKKTIEIPILIEVLRNLHRNSCTADELDILYSKVCSTEQIIQDY